MATNPRGHGHKEDHEWTGETSYIRRFEQNEIMAGHNRNSGGITHESTPSGILSERTQARLHSCRIIPSASNLLALALLTVFLLITPSTAVFINFQNCLSPNVINSNPTQLQFVPLYVWSTFNVSAPSHNLNITVYGNVAGIATQQPYPPPNDPQWNNPNETVGKIPDIAGNYTTFTTHFNVLEYTPYNPPALRFCNTSALTPCPLTPVFNFTGNE